MRRHLSLIVASLLTAATLCLAQTDAISKSKAKQAGASHADQAVIDSSRADWEAYKSRNVAAIKALVAEDYVSYSLAGPSTLKEDIATIEKLNIESYTLDEPHVAWATKDVAILRYKCNLKGSFDGKPFQPVHVTEVWVNRGGKWRIVSYQETALS
jgi:ketosteroid isomerase-like protein